MFKVGDRVVNARFGVGTIREINENWKMLVEFDTKNTLLHSGSFAKGNYRDSHCWWCSAEVLTKCSENNKKEKKEMKEKFEGKYKVIFNAPATILFVDGKKYVVKAHDEVFDEEKGLAMAILRSFGISHLDLKRMLKGAKVQKKEKVVKEKVVKEEVVDQSTTEENKEYAKQQEMYEECGMVEKYYGPAKSPVGKHRGKPYTFKIGDAVVVRDCYTYKEQKSADVLNLLNKQLMICDIFEDDFTKYYAVRYNNSNYFFVGSELEPITIPDIPPVFIHN